MIAGNSWVGWILSPILAVFVFLVLMWLVPLLAALVGLAIPHVIVVLGCLLVAAFVLFNGYWRGRLGTRV
jgi:pilus assembly protein TadC